jgi:hypothetical protein
MISYDQSDPEARFLYEKAGFAAYSGYRAFELEVDERFDDAKQEAVLTFWDLYRKDKGEDYAFVGAKHTVVDFLLAKSCPSRNCISVRELIPKSARAVIRITTCPGRMFSSAFWLVGFPAIIQKVY